MTDILVNKSQWDALSDEEQQKITNGLIGTGAMRNIDRIVGDDSVPPMDENTELEPLWNPIKDVCQGLCDAAAIAALGWCTTNTGGIGLAVCIAAAEAVRAECKKRC
ncbi:hypothetical protein [Pseudomonas sp.]|uniref:hypothetical protein n=1 Tax=Pseudomonas sp. TaxID=306 RepID=UPI003D0EDBC9